MATRASQTGPTRDQLTDEQFACYCRALDILARVKRRMKLKEAQRSAGEVQSEGGIDYDLC